MRGRVLRVRAAAVLLLCGLLASSGCQGGPGGVLSVEPRELRDVPAARLAFRFEADVAEEKLPEHLKREEAEEPLAMVRTDFETRRQADALVRTVLDPAGQRALALYGTSETEENDFRLDLYGADGNFIRNILPPDLMGFFKDEAAWSPDGQHILFIAYGPALARPGPSPGAAATPDTGPQPEVDPSVAQPTPTPAAAIPSVPAFRTEQVYVGDRDGFNLRPLTQRPGLIYFQLSWSPDGRQVAALACREDEWDARRDKAMRPAGRPRLITLEGQERLLDDRLTDVTPVWSPDGSKVATAFEYEVAVYDVAGSSPTGASLPLHEPLRASSADYDARVFKKEEPAAGNANAAATPAAAPEDGVLISLNPFVRLEWPEPETLYAQTAFVRFYRNEPFPTLKYTRWHVLHLSPQAALLSRN